MRKLLLSGGLLAALAFLLLKKLSTERITFCEVTEADVPLVYAWLQEPHVSKWWPTPTKDIFFRDWFASLRPKGAFPYLVLVDDKPIGLIQYYAVDPSTSSWLPPLPSHTLGTDQYIGDVNYLGKGYGVKMIQAFIPYLKSMLPDTTTIIVDPDPKNIAAIKCYEKVGFVKLGEFTAPWGPALEMAYTID